MGTTQGFNLEELKVRFKPDVPELTSFSITISIQDWQVPSLPWFTVDQVYAQISAQKPLDEAQRLITGELKALLTLGSVQLGVITSFDESSVWKLRLGAQAAQLSGLSDLTNLVSADTVTAQVPAGLPTNGGFEMAVFGFSYDSLNSYFPEIDFAIKSELDWEIIADLFILDAIDIAILITQANASAARMITGRITGKLTLLGVQFALSASKPEAGQNWTFKGWLDGPGYHRFQ